MHLQDSAFNFILVGGTKHVVVYGQDEKFAAGLSEDIREERRRIQRVPNPHDSRSELSLPARRGLY